MEIIIWFLVSLALVNVTWFFYVAVMSWKYSWGNMSLFARTMAAPYIITGYLLDIALNVIGGTLFFLEPPRELLFTTRLTRHKSRIKYTWRKRLAIFICSELLDIFDDGKHC